MTIWYTLWPFDIVCGQFGIVCGHFGINYPVLVCLDQEKSGNPDG
jgi:hypothetical protein